MPISDPRAGSVYICLVATVLFLAIVAGGALLVIYMIRPVSEHWLPIAGVSLVCLPWFFWLLTFLYRILSRFFCGLRSAVVADGSGGAGSVAGCGTNEVAAEAEECAVVQDSDEAAAVDSDDDDDGDGGTRRVHFGGAVVVGSDQHRADRGGEQEPKNVVVVESEEENENSFASHESEIPLKLSMAS